jgi:hypothetical protein
MFGVKGFARIVQTAKFGFSQTKCALAVPKYNYSKDVANIVALQTGVINPNIMKLINLR